MRTYLINFFILYAVFCSAAWASKDFKDIELFLMKQSNIEYHKVDDKEGHQVLLSSPKRINNEIVVEKDILQNGQRHIFLTALPKSEKLIDGFNFYRSLLMEQGELLFECSRRACGVSSYWANDILDERRLSGRDSDQYYVAGTIDHGDKTYLFSVYLVSNILRQNLAFISVIEQDEHHAAWHNGLVVNVGTQLPKAILTALKDQLANNSNLYLYVASYTNKEKYRSINEMKQAVDISYLEIQNELSESLNISTDRIRQQFVGSFHEQIVEGQNDTWFRLFLFED